MCLELSGGKYYLQACAPATAIGTTPTVPITSQVFYFEDSGSSNFNIGANPTAAGLDLGSTLSPSMYFWGWLICVNNGDGCIDVPYDSLAADTAVQLYQTGPIVKGAGWNLNPVSGGYQIISNNSGYCLDYDGVNIVQNSCGSSTVIWSLVPLDSNIYNIRVGSLCLSPTGSRLSLGACYDVSSCVMYCELDDFCYSLSGTQETACNDACVSQCNANAEARAFTLSLNWSHN
jgi:hypothetical protein